MMESIIHPDPSSYRRRKDDNGIPWQAKFVTTVGVVGCIALYLVYFMTNDMRSGQSTLINGQNAHAAQSMETIRQTQDIANVLRQLERTMTKVCINTARTNTALDNCTNK